MASGKIVKYFKRLIVSSLILLLVVFAVTFFSSTSKTARKAKPFAEDFFAILMQDDIRLLFDKFAKQSGVSWDEFDAFFGALKRTYGKLQSYKYDRYSASGTFGGTMSGFYVYYTVEFTKAQKAQAIIGLSIDHLANHPKFEISSFSVTGKEEKQSLDLVFAAAP